MKIIIIGCGEVGMYLTKTLSEQNHNIVCIDTNADRLKKIEEEHDVQTMHGIGSSVTVLKIAESDKADVVVAVTGSDEMNITACSFAKKMGAKHCIARVRHPSYLIEGDMDFYKSAGIDAIVSPEREAASEIAERVLYPGVIKKEDFADKAVELIRVLVSADSNARGKKISEVKLPANSLILSISRKDDLIIPSGSDVICANDVIAFLASKKNAEEVSKILHGKDSRVKRVTVIGGSYIGLFLCKSLELKDVDVKLFEPNLEKCQFLSEHLVNAKIINGHGTDKELLAEENVNCSDMFVAVTDNDEINITAGLLSKSIGVSNSIIVNHNPNFSTLFKQTGLFHSISPRHAIASRILAYVHKGNVSLMSVIKENEAEIFETTIKEDFKDQGKAIKDVELPRGLLIAMIIRNGEVMIPSGKDRLTLGDRVLIFSKKEAIKSFDTLLKTNS